MQVYLQRELRRVIPAIEDLRKHFVVTKHRGGELALQYVKIIANVHVVRADAATLRHFVPLAGRENRNLHIAVQRSWVFSAGRVGLAFLQHPCRALGKVSLVVARREHINAPVVGLPSRQKRHLVSPGLHREVALHADAVDAVVCASFQIRVTFAVDANVGDDVVVVGADVE
eukprot:scaffold5345_cov306-Pinguiococcus_pyrenoidosus.AAC.1